jgi:hypothetical protein
MMLILLMTAEDTIIVTEDLYHVVKDEITHHTVNIVAVIGREI